MSARRPNVFDQSQFERSLRSQGCPESFVGPITSDFRLFAPLALRALGPDGILRLAKEAQPEFGLGDQDAAWQVAAKYIHGWADEALREFKRRRSES